jgi:tRNA A-37 threonylcarbamoyl transferase component Bud32
MSFTDCSTVSSPSSHLFSNNLNTHVKVGVQNSSTPSKTRKSKKKIDSLKSPPIQISHYIDRIASQEKNSKKWIWSTMRIALQPHQEAIKSVYPDMRASSQFWSSEKPFDQWSKEECQSASEELIRQGIPLTNAWVNQIYRLVQLKQKELTKSSRRSYPALFSVKAYYSKPGKPGKKISRTKKIISFDLQIHSNRKIYAIFLSNEETFIQTGYSKTVFKVFSLGIPKMIAYSLARLDNHSPRSLVNAAKNEERFLTRLQGSPFIPKVYDIFYYSVVLNDEICQQQIITMKYYQLEFIDLLRGLLNDELRLSDQEKARFTCQLLKVVFSLHQKQIVHRDIKPENILLNLKKEIRLIDFGLSCEADDVKALKDCPGTARFAAPEVFNQEADQSKFAQDMWSVGCVIWILWFQNYYPWYREVSIETKDASIKKEKTGEALELMKQFTYSSSPSTQSFIYPFWRILYYDHKYRWSALQALVYFQNVELHLSKEPTYDFKDLLIEDLKDMTSQYPLNTAIAKKLNKY